MHDPVIWRNPTNRNDPKHYEWLKSGDTPTIYMMEAYEEVPQAVKYPLDEVLMMTPGVRYITSSIAYAIALAVYKGYKRIELYGVEMETNTEYYYQRQGVVFWLGVAYGKGIEVAMDTRIFDDPLYGYEGGTAIPYAKFEQIIHDAEAAVSETETRYNKERDDLNFHLQELAKNTSDKPAAIVGKVVGLSMTASQYGFADGKRQEGERYKAKADAMIKESGGYIFSRQEFEQMIVTHGRARDDAMAQANAFAGKLQAIFEQIIPLNNLRKRGEKMNLFLQSLQKYIEVSTKVGVFDGASKLNVEMMKLTDKLVQAAGGEKSFDVVAERLASKEPVIEEVNV